MDRHFLRVYQLPKRLTNGYCMAGPKPITFLNVDWFEVIEPTTQEELAEFIKGKRYYSGEYSYLVICDSPAYTFTIGDSFKGT